MCESQQVPAVVQDDEWLDEMLSQTFPASDPILWGRKDTDAADTKEELRRTRQARRHEPDARLAESPPRPCETACSGVPDRPCRSRVRSH